MAPASTNRWWRPRGGPGENARPLRPIRRRAGHQIYRRECIDAKVYRLSWTHDIPPARRRIYVPVRRRGNNGRLSAGASGGEFQKQRCRSRRTGGTLGTRWVRLIFSRSTTCAWTWEVFLIFRWTIRDLMYVLAICCWTSWQRSHDESIEGWQRWNDSKRW